MVEGSAQRGCESLQRGDSTTLTFKSTLLAHCTGRYGKSARVHFDARIGPALLPPDLWKCTTINEPSRDASYFPAFDAKGIFARVRMHRGNSSVTHLFDRSPVRDGWRVSCPTFFQDLRERPAGVAGKTTPNGQHGTVQQRQLNASFVARVDDEHHVAPGM